MSTDNMHRNILAIVMLLAVASAGAGQAMAQGDGARMTMSLDGEWEFRLDPDSVGEEERWFIPSVSFSEFIEVPGAWDAQGFGEETGKLEHNFIGKGWYRRVLTIPGEWKNRRVFICFGGVYRSAKVWVDGHFIGRHLGYISDFEFDITEQVEPGKAVTIVILVDSEQRWSEDALQGCMDIIDHFFTYWGGIWSHVSLEARSNAWLHDLFVEPRTAPTGCAVNAAVLGDPSWADTARVTIANAEGAEIASMDLAASGPVGQIRAEFQLPDATLWTPETPYLHTAKVELLDEAGDSIDEVESRFGIRTIEIRDTDFYLNGKKYILPGYGDDCVYPDTIAPPPDKQFYIDRLRVAKSYGFRYVRHHSHFVSPEYYDACDEVGMFVSPELPIAYPRFYNRAHGAAIELYKKEWAAVIKRYRNHPCIFNWCMSNELWEGMPRVGPDLYKIAKSLDPTRPVIDSDGLFQPGFDDGTKDRPTLDFLTIMFNILTTPLDNPEKFKTGRPLKPVIGHELGNYVHFPRLDLIEMFDDKPFKPFWLEDARNRITRAGLLDEARDWSHVSQQLYLLCHKANIEALRKNPYISGYHWWLLQPWYCGSNGLLDVLRRPVDITPEQVKRFNAAVVLLQDGVQQTYSSGDDVEMTLSISNYSGSTIEDGSITCRLVQDGGAVETRSLSTGSISNGTIVLMESVRFTLPTVSEPERFSIEAALESDMLRQTNDWTLWVYPRAIPGLELQATVYASPDTMGLLSAFSPEPMPEQNAMSDTSAVYIARQPTEPLVRAAENGSCIVLLSPAGVFPTDCTSYKSAWWLGVFEGDTNAGTYVYDNPVTRGLTPGRWCDASWFHLIQGAQTFLLDGLDEKPEVLVRALNTHGAPHPFSRYVDFEYVWRNKALLAQAKVGDGTLIISGFNFDVAMKNGGPEAAYVLGRLIEYAATFPTPEKEWSGAFIRSLVQKSPFTKGPVVSGFSRLVYHKGKEGSGQSYRERSAMMHQIQQEEALHRIEWETAPVPDAPYVTFVFAGGFPFKAPPPKLPGFTLTVNGQRVLNFDTTKTQMRWESDDGRTCLLYVPGHVQPSWGDTAGLFYLAVPGDLLVPGAPCRLGARSRGSDNSRYFGLNPYADILSEAMPAAL